MFVLLWDGGEQQPSVFELLRVWRCFKPSNIHPQITYFTAKFLYKPTIMNTLLFCLLVSSYKSKKGNGQIVHVASTAFQK